MDRNDYVSPQKLINTLPEEPTEEYVLARRIKPLALYAYTNYAIYITGYRDAMKEWLDAIDKTDAAISTTDFDGLWEQLFAATAVARGAVQRVEELRATNAALSASFCEEKEALEAKIKELEKQVNEANAKIKELEDQAHKLENKKLELEWRNDNLIKNRGGLLAKIDDLEKIIWDRIKENDGLHDENYQLRGKIKELEGKLEYTTRIRKNTEAQINKDRQNRDKTIDVLLDTVVRPIAESDSLIYGRTWILTDERGDIHRCASYDSVGGVKPIILGTIARGGAIVSIERRNPEL